MKEREKGRGGGGGEGERVGAKQPPHSRAKGVGRWGGVGWGVERGVDGGGEGEECAAARRLGGAVTSSFPKIL